MRRTFTLSLIIMLLGVNGALAQQTDNVIISPMYTHTLRISASLDINNGVASCCGSVVGRYDVNFTSVRVTLEKRAIGSSYWSYVDSWSKTVAGFDVAKIEETKSVSSTYDYRVHVIGTITDSEGVILEETSKYSGIVRY